MGKEYKNKKNTLALVLRNHNIFKTNLDLGCGEGTARIPLISDKINSLLCPTC
jgi:hypothetical protein